MRSESDEKLYLLDEIKVCNHKMSRANCIPCECQCSVCRDFPKSNSIFPQTSEVNFITNFCVCKLKNE